MDSYDIGIGTETYDKMPRVTEEDRQKARRVVCGAEACRGATDAKVILEALGLLDPRRG